jgi:hypothetical protein
MILKEKIVHHIVVVPILNNMLFVDSKRKAAKRGAEMR